LQAILNPQIPQQNGIGPVHKNLETLKAQTKIVYPKTWNHGMCPVAPSLSYTQLKKNYQEVTV